MKEIVFITGASSGLGRQMAIEFAKRGYQLALSARREDELRTLQQQLRSDSVKVEIYPCDVCDEERLQVVLLEAEKEFGHINKIIANAGIGKNGRIGQDNFDSARSTIAVNVTAAMATAHYGMQIFNRQGYGHIVFIGSVAGYRGLPTGGAYSASKAAIRCYAESLRAENHNRDIDVTVLNPGYIDTPINQGAASRPFLISLEKGGPLLVNLIEKKVKRATVPAWPWALLAPLLSILPTAVISRMA